MLATHGALRPALGRRWMASAPPNRLRKLLRRGKLMAAELQDWTSERQMLWRAKLKEQFLVAKDLKKLPPGVGLHAVSCFLAIECITVIVTTVQLLVQFSVVRYMGVVRKGFQLPARDPATVFFPELGNLFFCLADDLANGFNMRPPAKDKRGVRKRFANAVAPSRRSLAPSRRLSPFSPPYTVLGGFK